MRDCLQASQVRRCDVVFGFGDDTLLRVDGVNCMKHKVMQRSIFVFVDSW